MVEVVGAHRVRVQVDAPEVHDPRELRHVAYDDLVGGAARRERSARPSRSTRGAIGRPLLEEELAVGAVT